MRTSDFVPSFPQQYCSDQNLSLQPLPLSGKSYAPCPLFILLLGFFFTFGLLVSLLVL